jgi:hypothetical protein
MYRSEYGVERVTAQAAILDAQTGAAERWTIYDNTAAGAATGDALRLRALF